MWSNDFWGTYDTEANLTGGRGVICSTDSSTPTVPSATGNICSTASTASTADLKPGWAGFTKAYGMDFNNGGSPLVGAFFCP
jgi:hypothetical protein